MMPPSTPYKFALSLALLLSTFAFALADTPIIRMARISVVDGEVSYRRAKQDDQNAWYDAATNTPLGENDQVFTGQRGRAEIQMTGRNIVRLDFDTSFKIAQFTTAVTQISLPVGTATFRVDSLDPRQFDVVAANQVNTTTPLFFEVNTPTVAVTLLKPGIYRISVQDDGTTEVSVRSGEAEVYNQELDTITIKKGRRIVVEGNNVGDYRFAKLQDRDSFDHWSDRRDDELAIQADSLSARYVPQGIPGVYDLDRHGDWWYTSDYGYVWSPRSVASGWSPYRVGAWQWYSDWGWTWISTEPWGWTPYHYGRWAYTNSRWCWVPRSGLSVGFSWAPALVTFFGWGNNRGYNNGYRDGYRDGRYDSVGWIPLGPGEHYYNPHWRGGNTVIVNNTYVNSRIDNQRNYNAPGGIIRMDGRRFDTRRVAVNNIDNTPAQQSFIRSGVTTRGDVFRPAVGTNSQPTVHPAADPTRRPTAQREVFSRGEARGGRMITPNDNRNGSIVNGAPTLRNSDVSDRMARPERVNRDRDNNRDAGNRNTETNRTAVTPDAATTPNRPGNGETYRGNRNNGDRNTNTETRRIERPVTPAPSPETPANNNRVERPQRPLIYNDNNRREENRREATPPDYSPRRTETERREATPRRAEEAPRESRQEAPRATPRQEAPRESRQEAPREVRREERQAPREQPRSERPASPAPAPRQEAPPRQEARPNPPSPNPPSNDSGNRGERPTRRPSSE